MPLYSYEHVLTGQTIDLVRPVDRRDDDIPAGYRRITVPQRVGIANAFPDDSTVDYKMARKGLRQMEEKYGADRMARESGFSVKELKRVWQT